MIPITIKISDVSLKNLGKWNDMDTREAVAERIRELCRLKGITPNGLSNLSGVPQATVKSILNGESKNPGVVTLKKLCDGLEMTLEEFFATDSFNSLEQEIK
ncbi:MAG: helix-turn-helix transcriptional regulator [Spirochaetales bacterium]|nr:helix-turn-helix transcriptional regulator [Spirochaetales bacterium]